MATLRRYRSFKVVSAGKVLSLARDHLMVEDDVGSPLRVEVDSDWLRKHEPQVGGYFVVYDDGYRSWSPGPTFERGYQLLP